MFAVLFAGFAPPCNSASEAIAFAIVAYSIYSMAIKYPIEAIESAGDRLKSAGNRLRSASDRLRSAGDRIDAAGNMNIGPSQRPALEESSSRWRHKFLAYMASSYESCNSLKDWLWLLYLR